MKLYKENGQALPAWQILGNLAPAPTGFTESTDLSEWDKYAFNLDRDFKCVRDSMKDIVTDLGAGDTDAGFNLLDAGDKTLCCKYKIASDALREAHAGVSALVVYGDAYNANMHGARSLRANHVVSEISNRLPAQKLIIMSDSKAVFESYKDFGVEGTAYGDPISGVGDYIDGTGDFTGNGLRQSGYEPVGMALNDFCDLLLDILLGDGVTV